MMIIIKCYVCLLFSVKWFQDVSVLFWEFKAYFSDRQVHIMTLNYLIIISCRHRPGGGWTVTIKSQFTSTSASHPQSDRTSHLDALQGFNLILCFQGRWFVDSVRLHVSSELAQHHTDKQQHVLPDDGWGLLKRFIYSQD